MFRDFEKIISDFMNYLDDRYDLEDILFDKKDSKKDEDKKDYYHSVYDKYINGIHTDHEEKKVVDGELKLKEEFHTDDKGNMLKSENSSCLNDKSEECKYKCEKKKCEKGEEDGLCTKEEEIKHLEKLLEEERENTKTLHAMNDSLAENNQKLIDLNNKLLEKLNKVVSIFSEE